METQFYSHIANGTSEKVSLLFRLNELVGLKTIFEQQIQVSPISDGVAERHQLMMLRHEHRKLDKQIDSLRQNPAQDTLSMQRYKKRKLALKDEIKKLESLALPDIIAWFLAITPPHNPLNIHKTNLMRNHPSPRWKAEFSLV